jgi:hypothetical protein
MTGNTSPPATHEVFVERLLDYAEGETVRPVTVRIYTPVERALREWWCVLEIQGLSAEGRVDRHETTGVDSVQALFHAMRIAEVELDGYDRKLSWGNCKPWEPIRLRAPEEKPR